MDEGYTDVIHVPINRSGSSTYNNAVMAQGMLREGAPGAPPEDPSAGPHTLLFHALRLVFMRDGRKLQNGAEISHVIQEFESQMNKMETVLLGPYSLKQMKKSGRILPPPLVMGELMGIRPIITPRSMARPRWRPRCGDDKVVPAMVELAKKRSEGVEDS